MSEREGQEAGREAPVESLTAQHLRGRFPEAILEVKHWRNETTIVLRAAALVAACRFLRDDPELQFDFLSSVTGVDRQQLPENSPRLEVVYHLYSLHTKRRVRLKVRVDDGEAVPSLTEVWPTANWHEREVFDMFGVPFTGHPDLRRILMPEDWEGHPLRKDYPVEATPKWWEEEPA
ncbi:MAG: NADH-quinone oxidoreductase subunit C [candidate division NC10 bacterium]|nr:NADH-quinone oxidoreductase subunit C [candidate division NC10 bacterium]